MFCRRVLFLEFVSIRALLVSAPRASSVSQPLYRASAAVAVCVCYSWFVRCMFAEANHPTNLPVDSACGRRRRWLLGGQDVRARPLSRALPWPRPVGLRTPASPLHCAPLSYSFSCHAMTTAPLLERNPKSPRPRAFGHQNLRHCCWRHRVPGLFDFDYNHQTVRQATPRVSAPDWNSALRPQPSAIASLLSSSRSSSRSLRFSSEKSPKIAREPR